MSSKTTNNSTSESEIPALHSFEFDKTSIGKIKSSVNKFRGCVSMPLDLLTLPGIEGLDVKLSILYTSNIKNNLNTWNIDAATSILGLGWQMPIEMITVDKSGCGSTTSDTYYLVSNGSANPMVKTGETVDGNWTFQLRNFEFWSIQYNPYKKIWTIIKENGFSYTYGEGNDINSNATQWGISWGNWIGSSNNPSGQVRYPIAWNLSSIETPLGNSVQYQYIKIEQNLISSGLTYTQACYLGKVIDSYGRIITFKYGNKFGLLNPGKSNEGLPINEYHPRNTQIAPPTPNAYQDRFETYFLDAVEVTAADGNNLTGLKFTYDFINNAASSDSNYSLMYKRTLQSVFQYVDNGDTLPAIDFEYFPANTSSINPGALRSVIYPEGGSAFFEYKSQTITDTNSSKKIQITNPILGSIPRVWFGLNYVVFTYQSTNQIQIKIQSWNGQWVSQSFNLNKESLKDSLEVLTQENFFALIIRNTATTNDEMYLFRNDQANQDLKFGDWVMYNNAPFILNIKADSNSKSSFVAGNSFVIAYNPDYTSTRVQGFSYDWQSGRWNSKSTPILPNSSDCKYAAITAMQNYYAVSCYIPEERKLKNYLFYLTADGYWKSGSIWTLTNIDVVIDSKSSMAFLAISPSPSSLVLTYATSTTNSAINYSLRLFNWDEYFYVLNSSSPGIADLSSPILDNNSLYQIFNTSIIGSTVANNLCFLRNTGGNQQFGSVWNSKSFQSPGASSKINIASGDDINFLSPEDTSTANQWASFNPNNGTWSMLQNVPVGKNPTISGDYMTVGKSIYYRNTDENWILLPTQISSLNYPQSIQNVHSRYINYQDSDDNNASSYIITLENGTARFLEKLNNVKTYVPNGTMGTKLTSSRFLVTYPSSTKSFDESPTMDLWNLDDIDFQLNVTDTPVANLVIENKIDPNQSFSQSYYYANSPESQIVYNALIGTAQYPLVTLVPGIKEKANSPSSTPQGSSQFFYSNGLSQQKSLYPNGGIQNYQNILNGIQLAQKDYDSNGKLVSYQLNYWTVYSKDTNGTYLLGGYARCEKTAIMKDDIVQWSKAGYDRTTGLLLWQEKSYFDSDGIEKNSRTENTYAYQIPQYATLFKQLHLYSAVAMISQSVALADNSSRKYIKSQATTFRNWAHSDQNNNNTETGQYRLASYEIFDWIVDDTLIPVYPNDNTSNNWKLKSKIISRSKLSFLITEQIDSNGLHTSFLYDNKQHSLIAKFPNGSIAGNEVSYYGFEQYENNENWTIGSGAYIIPNDKNEVIDAHTGINSLCIGPRICGNEGIKAIFKPLRQNQQYIFSAWVKKLDSFDSKLGNASWKIIISGAGNYTVDFPETNGHWVYISKVITLTEVNSEANISISCENLNESNSVFIDNVRFSPLSCILEAYVYNNILEKPAVVIGPNGEISRKVFNRFQQEILSTNPADRTAILKSNYISRSGNQGTFSVNDPNNEVSIVATNGGLLTEFTHGSQWMNSWQSNENIWVVCNKELRQQSKGLAGTLTCLDSKIQTDYAFSILFSLLEKPTSPMGIHIGDMITIQWNPLSTSWQLLDNSGLNILPDRDNRAFNIPKKVYVEELNSGVISSALCSEFGKTGYILTSSDVIIKDQDEQNRWTITNRYNDHLYILRVINSDIVVYKIDTQWNILIDSSTIIFWANGKMIFSYTGFSGLSGEPSVFFGNQVSISHIATASKPMASISFNDSNGLKIQEQKYAGTSMVVSHIISDYMGRMAVRTKPAYVSFELNNLFTYCNDFASMNWVSGKIDGLINNAYPADKGYPFSRQIFETSPLARLIQESVPGEEFRVNGGNCMRIEYTSMQDTTGQAIYYKKITSNPNGNIFYQVSTLLDQVIHSVSIGDNEIRNECSFDDAGNAVILRSPNYFNPPANSEKNDWLTIHTYNQYNKLLTIEQGNNITTRFIYDNAGNIRFKQDAQGIIDGNFIYTKYDILSRPIETGYVIGNWDEQELQQYANTEPNWPLNLATWRQKNKYDSGIDDVENSIGRITVMQANNSNNGNPDVIESLSYDILGNTTADNLKILCFDSGKEKLVRYKYNDIGTIVQIDYPYQEYDYRVFYQINSLNQIISIKDQIDTNNFLSSEINTICNFSYDAEGKPLDNQLILAKNESIKQTYSFNSPNWLENIDNTTQQGSQLFNESITYTSQGYEGAAYYDGTIASTSVKIAEQQIDQYQYAYDSIGQLKKSNKVGVQSSSGIKSDVSYDANGNIVLFSGNQDYKYNYNLGSQKVNNVINNNDSKVLANFDYDENGNVTKLNTVQSELSDAFALNITYDPVSMLSVEIVDTKPDGATLNLLYGCRNERVMKSVTRGGIAIGSKFYIRGTSAMPLQETYQSADGNIRTSVNYIYGPGGLIAMRRLDGQSLEMYHILKDHLGSVRTVIDLYGTIIASYNYDTFGALKILQESTNDFLNYLYTGQEYDREIGLYNYRARFYCAAIGRFISIDPARQFYSPYIYASNNPILFIDPTGMFSIGNFFSAIGGILIGAVEILIGVAIDVVAAVVQVLSGGLGTPLTIGLGALSGVFYGAGINAITYSAFNFNDFSWKDYGIQMGIGSLTGALSGGFGAGLGIAAESVQTSLTQFATSTRIIATFVEGFGESNAATVLNAGAWLGEKGAVLAGLAKNGPVASGWGGLAKGLGIGVLKSEAIGISTNTGKNLILGNNWDNGLDQTIFSSSLSGSIGGLQVSNRIRYGTT